jgi:hypothetical protein
MSCEVGYGKPPKETQFRPDESGNPNGRPRGSARKSDKTDTLGKAVRELQRSKVYVVEGGKRKKVQFLKALLKRLAHDAHSGDVKARELLVKLFVQADQSDLKNQSEEVRVIVENALPEDAS